MSDHNLWIGVVILILFWAGLRVQLKGIEDRIQESNQLTQQILDLLQKHHGDDEVIDDD